MTDPEKTEYENVIRLLTAKVEELLTANERLTSELTAHQTLRAIYSDSTQPATVRVRAASAALGVESAPLKSVAPPLELVAQEYEPLSVVVERQRARMNRLLALPLEQRERLIQGVERDDDNSGDGSDEQGD